MTDGAHVKGIERRPLGDDAGGEGLGDDAGDRVGTASADDASDCGVKPGRLYLSAMVAIALPRAISALRSALMTFWSLRLMVVLGSPFICGLYLVLYILSSCSGWPIASSSSSSIQFRFALGIMSNGPSLEDALGDKANPAHNRVGTGTADSLGEGVGETARHAP